MNKNLLLAIMVVTLIPAFFNISEGITGMAVSDTTQQTSQSSGHFLSGAIFIYFLVSIVVLSIVASYLIALHNAGHKPKTVPKRVGVKHFEKVKNAWSNFKGFELPKINDDRAAQYIVATVAIVGLVAILIMLYR